jgi:hypothetical protein
LKTILGSKSSSNLPESNYSPSGVPPDLHLALTRFFENKPDVKPDDILKDKNLHPSPPSDPQAYSIRETSNQTSNWKPHKQTKEQEAEERLVSIFQKGRPMWTNYKETKQRSRPAMYGALYRVREIKNNEEQGHQLVAGEFSLLALRVEKKFSMILSGLLFAKELKHDNILCIKELCFSESSWFCVQSAPALDYPSLALALLFTKLSENVMLEIIGQV